MADKLKLEKSFAMFEEAQRLVPGGVAGIRRPYNFVPGEYPIFFDSAKGSHVTDVDGNDIEALTRLFDGLSTGGGKPHLVVAHTVKGKGVSFMENKAAWHHRLPTPEEYQSALAELAAARERA